jgi:hypothetical protein
MENPLQMLADAVEAVTTPFDDDSSGEEDDMILRK